MAVRDIGGHLLHAGSRDRIGRQLKAASARCVWLLAFVVIAMSPASAYAAVWFARAKASGDGTSRDSPIGSTLGLEAVTKPGDIIILLASDEPLDGGLTLKAGQTLIGHAESRRKPTVTNSSADRNGGNGIVLADDCRVVDIRIERTQASGILGVNVSGTSVLGVEVEGANQLKSLTTTEVSLLGRISHAGILFLTTQGGKAAANRLVRCRVKSAAGIGFGAFALKGGQNRLVISHGLVEGGALIPPLFDMGVVGFAEGKDSLAALEIADSVVFGRMSQQGRNMLAFAAADARATVRVERSTSGQSGQDGVVGVAAMVPATVEIEIRDSTLEKAAQMNLEGTILNLPPSDSTRASESLVSIDVARCVIRDAGFVDGFRGEAQNIWLAPSVFDKGPFPLGRYRLEVRDSIVEKGR